MKSVAASGPIDLLARAQAKRIMPAPGVTMICTVYWRKGGFILVPDCMKASRAAEQLYGPLRHCGSVDTAKLPAAVSSSLEQKIEQELFAPLSPALAMQLGYEATQNLPLPAGFFWQEGDWWKTGGELSLQYGLEPAVVVATIAPIKAQAGWMCITNRHRPWAFQGISVCPTRAAALQFVAIWADANAQSVRGSIASQLH